MKSYQLIAVTVIVASLALFPSLVSPAQAEEQGAGIGSAPPQKEMTGGITEKQLTTQPGTSSGPDLGRESERLMKVPEAGEFSHLQNPRVPDRQMYDLETLENLRVQDEISSLSF
jgi:hypothetical protein